jgi:hypothetical protein
VKRNYQIWISPVHGIQLQADDMTVVQNVLIFKRDGREVGQFTQYMGWLELEEAPKESASVSPLSLVPRGEPPSGGEAA